jgi:hypothetical protein
MAKTKQVADTQAQTFLKEVDEHLHYERMMELWKQHKNTLFASLAVLFIGVAGFKYYEQYSEQTLQEQAKTWWNVRASKTPEEAKTALNKVIEENTFGYRMLSRMELVKMALVSGDYGTALAELHAIQNDSDADILSKDLATFYEAQLLMSSDTDKAKTLFTSLDNSDSPFKLQALEMLAMLAESKGSKTEAVALYERIAESRDISSNMRGRAKARIRALKESSVAN